MSMFFLLSNFFAKFRCSVSLACQYSMHVFNFVFQYIFTITYKSEGQRNYDLRTETEAECNAWIDAIKRARFVLSIVSPC